MFQFALSLFLLPFINQQLPCSKSELNVFSTPATEGQIFLTIDIFFQGFRSPLKQHCIYLQGFHELLLMEVLVLGVAKPF